MLGERRDDILPMEHPKVTLQDDDETTFQFQENENENEIPSDEYRDSPAF